MFTLHTSEPARKTTAAIAAIAALALPFGTLAGSSAASEVTPGFETGDGCIVIIPKVDDQAAGHGDKYLSSEIKVECPTNIEYQFRSQLWERDQKKFGDCGSKDDKVGSFVVESLTRVGTGELRIHPYPAPPGLKVKKSYDCAGDRRGEFYQKVGLRTRKKGNTSWNAWTGWREGDARSIRVV